jgi:hypothetical protein
MRNSGTLAPSHRRVAAPASRLSGGVVTITYAAAAPADKMTRFAINREDDRVTLF